MVWFLPVCWHPDWWECWGGTGYVPKKEGLWLDLVSVCDRSLAEAAASWFPHLILVDWSTKMSYHARFLMLWIPVVVLATAGISLRVDKCSWIHSSWCSNSFKLWLNSALKLDEIKLFSGDILYIWKKIQISSLSLWVLQRFVNYFAGWTTFPMSDRRSTSPLANLSNSNLDAELTKAVLRVK